MKIYQSKISTEQHTGYKRTYRSKNVERRKAHNNLAYHVKAGNIKRSSCIKCGEIKVQGHHYKGYSIKNQLVVQWLCDLHHREAHHAN